MILWQFPRKNPKVQPRHGEDLGATVCVVEKGDAVMVETVAAGYYENTESAILLTLTAGPDQTENNIEIVIPKSRWHAFANAVNSAPGPRTTF